MTTPQEVVLGDVRRGIDLFRRREIPILGVVENMSHFICENCSHENRPFATSHHGLDKESFGGIEVLAKIPLSREISEAADSGCPYVVGREKNEGRALFYELAKRVAIKLGSQQPAMTSNVDELQPN